MPAAEPTVNIQSDRVQGRQLEDQTKARVIRDYLESWKAMESALELNQSDLLEMDFIGTAKNRLNSTIQEQAAAGIHSRYQDRSHDIQIVFYSPEGLSIQLVDTVNYAIQVFDRDKQIANQQVNARFIVVLTPGEVRWRVRVLQEQSGE
jgi:hypothetical protein